MNSLRLILLVVPLFIGNRAAFVAVEAAEPVGWRTNSAGRFDNVDPPLEWSEDENVVWKAELPGGGHSSPIVVGDRVLVACEPADLVCLNREDGKALWTATVGYGDAFPAQKVAEIEADHDRANELRQEMNPLRKELNVLKKAERPNEEAVTRLEEQIKTLDERIKKLETYPMVRRGGAGNSTGTVVSDGENLYTGFGTGLVASHKLDGQVRWVRWVNEAQPGFGHSASPVLAGGRLIVHYGDLVGLDPSDGREIWRADVAERHGTPVAAEIGDAAVVVTPSGGVVRAEDGKVLAERLFSIGHASPVVHGGVVYSMHSGANVAIQLPDVVDDEFKTTKLWQSDGMRQRRFASPLYDDGLLYTVMEIGVLDVIDAKTGEEVYRKRLNFGDGRVYTSPSAAGGKIHVSSTSGATFVIEPGREYKQLAKNQLPTVDGNPVFAAKRMYVRGGKTLYCIGK